MFFKKFIDGEVNDFIFVQNNNDELIEISPEDVLIISSQNGKKDGLAVFETTTGTYYAIHTEEAARKLAEHIGVPFELVR